MPSHEELRQSSNDSVNIKTLRTQFLESQAKSPYVDLYRKHLGAGIFTEKNLPISNQQYSGNASLPPPATSTVNIVSGSTLKIDSDWSSSCGTENGKSVPALFGNSFTAGNRTVSGCCRTNDLAGTYDPDQLIIELESVMDIAMAVNGLDQSEPVVNGHHASGPQSRYTVNQSVTEELSPLSLQLVMLQTMRKHNHQNKGNNRSSSHGSSQ